MTKILKAKYSWNDSVLADLIDTIEVTKEQLETIVDNWLILDEEHFENYPSYVRKIHLAAISVFSSTRPIEDDRLALISQTQSEYRYLVKEN